VHPLSIALDNIPHGQLLQPLGRDTQLAVISTGQLAENSALESSSPFELRLVLGRNNEHLLTDQLKGRLISAVQDAVGTGLNLFFRIADEVGDTTAAQLAQKAGEHVAEARSAIDNDPNVQDLVELFDGEVVAESIQPRQSNSSVSKGAAGD
jgi:hypothetical protein